MPFGVCCLLIVVWCLMLRVARSLLLVGCFVLSIVVKCSLRSACCLLCSDWRMFLLFLCLLLGVGYVLRVVCSCLCVVFFVVGVSLCVVRCSSSFPFFFGKCLLFGPVLVV